MEVGQWRITTWTGPNRDSVYEWIRGIERKICKEDKTKKGMNKPFFFIHLLKLASVV